jgi:hypothetical protein
VRDSIGNALEWGGWTVHRVGKARLIVSSHKGRPVTSVEMAVASLPPVRWPKVGK